MTSPAERVLAHIDRETLARECLAYVSTASETGDEAAGSAFLAEMLRRRGWEVALDDAAAGRANVMTRLPGTGGGRTLLINGHVDTIPIGKSWPARRDESWIWGRGAEDMKAGLVAMVHAAHALERAGGGQTPEEIGLALVGDASLNANELGIPCAYYGPGYETAHSDAERVSIDRLVHIAGVYALTMMEFCGGTDAV